MKSKGVIRCSILSLLLMLMIGFAAVSDVEATISPGLSINIAPVPSNLTTGQLTNVSVFVSNSSFVDGSDATSGLPTLVPVTLLNTTVETDACSAQGDVNGCPVGTELPGTLEFVICIINNPGVATCVVDPGNSNHVLITFQPGGFTLGAGAQLG